VNNFIRTGNLFLEGDFDEVDLFVRFTIGLASGWSGLRLWQDGNMAKVFNHCADCFETRHQNWGKAVCRFSGQYIVQKFQFSFVNIFL